MKKNQKGFTLTELLVVITIIGILAALLMTSLARGKAKAYRIACVSNIGNVFKAGLMFGQDNGERLPWQLTKHGVGNHIGAPNPSTKFGGATGTDNLVHAHHTVTNPNAPGGVFGIAAMKIELTTPKILLSPCDASRKVNNIALEEKWKDEVDTKKNQSASRPDTLELVTDGSSYCLGRGADTMRPASIYSVTRNAPNNLTGSWLGNDTGSISDNVLAGLSSSQGQLVTMDGGARQSQDSDLGTGGALVKPAIDAIGGVAKGKTSTVVLR